MGYVKHILSCLEPYWRLAIGFCTCREQATLATVAWYPAVGRARKYTQEQNHFPRLYLALLIQTTIDLFESSWK